MSQALARVPTDAERQRSVNDRTTFLLFLAVMGLSVVLTWLTIGRATEPFPLALAMLVLACLVVVARPVAGVYLVVFFTLLTDAPITPSFPFIDFLSSDRSILFVDNKLAISPLELILGVTTVSWLLRVLLDRSGDVRFVRGRLLAPLAVFTGFLLWGFAYGMATGGSRYVAMWEMRPILYLIVFYLLITNLFRTRQQYHRLAIVALVALLVHTFLALRVWSAMSLQERDELESLVGHASAIQFSLVLLMVLALWVLPRVPWTIRILVLVAAVPMAWVWLVSGRRAAAVGLAIGIVLLGIVLSQVSPRTLLVVGPVVVLLGVGYLGAFWNSESQFGFPAQAMKTVIAPKDLSERDQASDLYRVIENFDIVTTIHSKPLTGVGFGQRFLRPIPLPDISFFLFYEYIPHNSVLWIWIKTGVGGFVAMLFLFASAVRHGVRAMLRLPPGRDIALAFAALAYVVMYLVFAYVDIAWDARSMIVLAVAMGICSELAHLPVRRQPSTEPSRSPTVAPAPVGHR